MYGTLYFSRCDRSRSFPLRVTRSSERLHIDLIIWPSAPEEICEGDSAQTHAMCWTVPVSFSPATNNRTSQKYIFRSCSLAFVPGRLRFSSWRNGRRSTTRIPSTFRTSIPLRSVSRWSRGSRRWKDSEISPHDRETKANFQVRRPEIAIVLRTEG